MIDNYLYTAGRYLPPRLRKEILREIEANIYDALEATYGDEEKTDAQIEAVLRRMGHPKTVALAYLDSPRCLIGPSLLESYWLVLKILLALTVGGVLISNIIAGAENIFLWFITLLGGIWQGGLTAIGMVTCIFAIIQYFHPDDQVEVEGKWSLAVLKEKPSEKSQVPPAETIGETIFLMLLLVLINSNILTILADLPNVVVITPVMDPALWTAIGWPINILIIVSIGYNLYLLLQGHYTKKTRIMGIVLNVVSLAVIGFVFFYPGLWSADVTNNQIDAETAALLSNTIRWSIQLVFAIIVIVTSIDTIKHVRGLGRA